LVAVVDARSAANEYIAQEWYESKYKVSGQRDNYFSPPAMPSCRSNLWMTPKDQCAQFISEVSGGPLRIVDSMKERDPPADLTGDEEDHSSYIYDWANDD
jgi:hypothetical protein